MRQSATTILGQELAGGCFIIEGIHEWTQRRSLQLVLLRIAVDMISDGVGLTFLATSQHGG